MEEDDSPIGRGVNAYWMPVAIAVLTLLAYSLTSLERFSPVLNNPAPSWVGLLVSITPFVAVAVYFVVRWRRK